MSLAGFPSQIKVALFDFDGVVADTEPLYVELDRRAIEHFGYAPTDAELLSFVGHPSEIVGPELLRAHGISVTTEDYLGVWDADAQIYGSPDLKPSPGLPELWDSLAAAGIAVGVVSNTPCASLVRALDRMAIMRPVSVIVGREIAERRKPDPDPYLRALELAGVPAKRAVAVEDSAAGIRAARAAGIFTVQYLGSGSADPADGVEANVDAQTPAFAALADAILGSGARG